MAEITLKAETGRPSGSSASKRLRREGKIPAVVYGHGIDPISIAVDARELRGALTGEAGTNALLTLEIEGGNQLAMAKVLQRDPVRNVVTHIDFQVVRRDEVVTTDVPIVLVGEAKAVVSAGGIVENPLTSLTLQATPSNIPSSIEVDVEGLAIGDVIRVGDLKLPSGVATLVDPEEAIVSAQGQQVSELDLIPEADAEALQDLAAAQEAAADADVAGDETPADAAGDGGSGDAASE
ncbi:MAG TPA: 50S ribosomal protein L25 [Acidimicrobiales bacterium]|nr:50S ribosomal protein L25 [Acidimicrobiales bacterium]